MLAATLTGKVSPIEPGSENNSSTDTQAVETSSETAEAEAAAEVAEEQEPSAADTITAADTPQEVAEKLNSEEVPVDESVENSTAPEEVKQQFLQSWDSLKSKIQTLEQSYADCIPDINQLYDANHPLRKKAQVVSANIAKISGFVALGAMAAQAIPGLNVVMAPVGVVAGIVKAAAGAASGGALSANRLLAAKQKKFAGDTKGYYTDIALGLMSAAGAIMAGNGLVNKLSTVGVDMDNAMSAAGAAKDAIIGNPNQPMGYGDYEARALEAAKQTLSPEDYEQRAEVFSNFRSNLESTGIDPDSVEITVSDTGDISDISVVDDTGASISVDPTSGDMDISDASGNAVEVDSSAVEEASQEISSLPENPEVAEVAETPSVETPATETPDVETPTAETAEVETPTTETPAAETADVAAEEVPEVEPPTQEDIASTPEPEEVKQALETAEQTPPTVEPQAPTGHSEDALLKGQNEVINKARQMGVPMKNAELYKDGLGISPDGKIVSQSGELTLAGADRYFTQNFHQFHDSIDAAVQNGTISSEDAEALKAEFSKQWNTEWSAFRDANPEVYRTGASYEHHNPFFDKEWEDEVGSKEFTLADGSQVTASSSEELADALQDSEVLSEPSGLDNIDTEAPAVEQPSVEQPAVEQPVAEQPVAEQPTVEQPAAEQAEVAETPTEAPAQAATETPATETAAETPAEQPAQEVANESEAPTENSSENVEAKQEIEAATGETPGQKVQNGGLAQDENGDYKMVGGWKVYNEQVELANKYGVDLNSDIPASLDGMDSSLDVSFEKYKTLNNLQATKEFLDAQKATGAIDDATAKEIYSNYYNYSKEWLSKIDQIAKERGIKEVNLTQSQLTYVKSNVDSFRTRLTQNIIAAHSRG